MNHKHICLLSGGHDSAKVAINVTRLVGKENVILLNHNINNKKEVADIKRFKMEISAYLGIPITYANYKNIQDDSLIPDQFDICIEKGAVTEGNGNAICTYYLKTKPFTDWLKDEFPDKNCTIYYGFDKKEKKRIIRRTTILGAMGYKTDYPLATWHKEFLPVKNSRQIGIAPPPILFNMVTCKLYRLFKGWFTALVLRLYVRYRSIPKGYHNGNRMRLYHP